MKLKSFGCSFVFGSELPDIVLPSNKPSQLTWPALLSRKLDLDYECYAHPGSGNFFTATQILDQLASDEPALYVINWTWIDRFDFIDLANKEHWDTLRPGKGSHPHGDFYYRNLHSELRDKLSSLQQIKLTTNALLESNQPFIMCYMDELIFDQRWHTTPAMLKQQEFLRPLMQHWTEPNWCKWAAKAGHAITPSNHLLTSGHQAVYQEILARLLANSIPTASQLSIDKIKTA